jgi:hypothetical protein
LDLDLVFSELDFSLFAETKMEKITPARKLFRPTSISPRRKSIMPDESRYPGFPNPAGPTKKTALHAQGGKIFLQGFNLLQSESLT